MNVYTHKYTVLKGVVHWQIFCHLQKFNMHTSDFSKWLLSFRNLLRLLPGVEAKINYSYAETLVFVSLKGCPPVEVKSRKTKENGISHLRENGPQLSEEKDSI